MQYSYVDKSSHSEVESYLMCRRRWYYSYAVQIQAQRTSDSLARGNVGHEILSMYYGARKNGHDHEEAGELALENFSTIANQYEVFDPDKLWNDLSWLLLWYLEKYQDDKFKVIETEILHEVQITEDYIMPIKIDLILEVPGRGIIIRDWKFTQDFYTVDKVDMSPQLVKYFAAAKELGIHADVLEYDQIRTRAFKNNPDPMERFVRTPVPLSADRAVRTMEEQFRVSREIAELRRLPIEEIDRRAVRNTYACMICPFVDLCSSDLNGGKDSQLLIESFYEKRKRR